MVSTIPVCPALSPDSGAPSPPHWAEWFLYIQEGSVVALPSLFCREGTRGEGLAPSHTVSLSALGLALS